MFNKDFYPTPDSLIRKMLTGIKYIGSMDKILEPSAGKGDILDYIVKNEFRQRYGNAEKQELSQKFDCIEIEPDLQSVLIGKGYNVVAEDFLNYKTFTLYDLIIMNPPFSDGAKHLLKAIELQERNGGQIVCLLNAETLKNAYSNDRKYLLNKLEQHNAKIEYVQNAFMEAERKTGVEVAIINLNIKKDKLDKDLFEEIRFEAVNELEEDYKAFEQRTGLVTKEDELKFMVQDYNTQINLLKNIKKAKETFYAFVSSLDAKPKNEIDSDYGLPEFNKQINTIRKGYWEKVMNIDTFNKYVTQKIKMQIYSLVERQANLEFNLENIYKVKKVLIDTFLSNLEYSAIAVFEEATKYTQTEYSKNIWLYNGWKTNKGSRLNKKIILPINFCSWYENNLDIGGKGSEQDRIKEIEKVLNYFDGFREFKSVFTGDLRNQSTADGDYLSIVAYKKGTTHITFNRLDLLDQFNLFVGRKKMWIPNSDEIRTDADKKKYESIKKEIFEHFDYRQDFNSRLALPSSK